MPDNRGAWLKADPEKARVMGRAGGKRSAQIRYGGMVQRSEEYQRGFNAGWIAGKRERLAERQGS